MCTPVAAAEYLCTAARCALSQESSSCFHASYLMAGVTSLDTLLLTVHGLYVPGAGSDGGFSTNDVFLWDLNGILLPNLPCRMSDISVLLGLLALVS